MSPIRKKKSSSERRRLATSLVGSDRGELDPYRKSTQWAKSHAQEIVFPNFFIHFWYSDVTVKRNETTSSHLNLSNLTETTDGGAGGGGSGGAVAGGKVSRCLGRVVCVCPRWSPIQSHEAKLTKRRRHRRRRSCCSRGTPRYRWPCASRCSYRRRCRCN